MSAPRVSLLLTGSGPALTATLQSALAFAAEPAVEILVAVPAAAPADAGIPASCLTSRVTLCRLPTENRTAARNALLARAQGEWVSLPDPS
ncbi:MAG TPA: hypothetical protein PKM88_04360, partial [bacterium]|nr:hypothetical protein [bacterium]